MFQPPAVVPVENLPEASRNAAMELVAQCLRENTLVMNVNLKGVTYDDHPLGNWEISVRCLD